MSFTPLSSTSDVSSATPVADVNNVRQTLDQRGNRYGEFHELAQISQDMKAVMGRSRNWLYLQAFQKEALEMTVHKIARILNGDASYTDSYHDIQGYMKLAEDRLLEQAKQVAQEDTQKNSLQNP